MDTPPADSRHHDDHEEEDDDDDDDDADAVGSAHSGQESSGVFSGGAPSTSGEPSPGIPLMDANVAQHEMQQLQQQQQQLQQQPSTAHASTTASQPQTRTSISAPAEDSLSGDGSESEAGAVGYCLQFVGTLVGDEGDVETPPPPSRQIIPLSISESRKLTLGQLVFHTTTEAEADPSPRYIFVYMVAEPVLTPT